MSNTDENLIFSRFSIRPTVSTGFQLPRDVAVTGGQRPVILLGRIDGLDLLMSHVQVMYCFIEEELKVYEEDCETVGFVRSYNAFHERTTPERFVEFWMDPEKCADTKDGVECPVKLE